MLYKQSVDNIKVVVMTLDGGLLDLNRLRYNYLKRLSKQYNKAVSREEFANNLGNMKTMYDFSSIKEDIDTEELNAILERDLFSYAKLKPSIQKDGIEELLQFFIQRNIKIAVVSTHKTKRAIQYLQLTRLYKYVDFVIGGDSACEALPDSGCLKMICGQLQVTNSEVLVVANFPNMVLAANSLLMNIVYVPDLIAVTPVIEASVYRVAKNPLEVINVFLFSKYDTVEMYSPLLGMSEKMDVATLNETYDRMLAEYGDDEKLVRLVKQTYQYFLTAIEDKQTRRLELLKEVENKQPSIDTLTDQENKIIEDFGEVVEDAESYPKEETAVVEEPKKFEEPEKVEEVRKSFFTILTEDDENLIASKEESAIPVDKPIEIAKEVIKENPLEATLAMQKDFVTQASSLNTLMDQINRQGGKPVDDDEFDKEEQQQEDATEVSKVWNIIIDVLYSIMLATVIVLVAMIVYVVAGEYLLADNFVASTIRTVVDGYLFIINTIYQVIFDGLHGMLGFIPDYDSLLMTSAFASKTGMETILYIIFHFVLIYIVKGVWYLIKKNIENDYDN